MLKQVVTAVRGPIDGGRPPVIGFYWNPCSSNHYKDKNNDTKGSLRVYSRSVYLFISPPKRCEILIRILKVD